LNHDNELPSQTDAANGQTRSTRESRRSGTLSAFEVEWSGVAWRLRRG